MRIVQKVIYRHFSIFKRLQVVENIGLFINLYKKRKVILMFGFLKSEKIFSKTGT